MSSDAPSLRDITTAETEAAADQTFGRDAWLTEPTESIWTDEATGYACAALRGPHGGWCGYVAVPAGHPAHGRHYYVSTFDLDDFEKLTVEQVAIQRRVNVLSAHGGLTYAGDRRPMGEAVDSWWFGFDCAHAGDFSPAYDKPESLGRPTGWGAFNTYRTLPYVEENVTALAAQLAEIGHAPASESTRKNGSSPLNQPPPIRDGEVQS